MNSSAEQPLQGTRILIAEDDAILAFDLGITLQKAGAKILGPTLTLAHTLALAQTAPMSAAVLDVRLRDEEIFPAAHELKGRGVGIVFYTGYAAVEQLRLMRRCSRSRPRRGFWSRLFAGPCVPAPLEQIQE
jgi:ActR/RegA family two-component response regulator